MAHDTIDDDGDSLRVLTEVSVLDGMYGVSATFLDDDFAETDSGGVVLLPNYRFILRGPTDWKVEAIVRAFNVCCSDVMQQVASNSDDPEVRLEDLVDLSSQLMARYGFTPVVWDELSEAQIVGLFPPDESKVVPAERPN